MVRTVTQDGVFRRTKVIGATTRACSMVRPLCHKDSASSIPNRTAHAFSMVPLLFSFQDPVAVDCILASESSTLMYWDISPKFTVGRWMVPAASLVFSFRAFRKLPRSLPGWSKSQSSSRTFKVMRYYIKISQEIAREINDKQIEHYLGGKGGPKDIISSRG
ncbi:hypothetical protein M422DRAFT_276660 [Sphaerobolus stellatus SS14]|uniref:Uncharacterized protein n=1 Tax=Sphaerobolus stellatus (strain SS14) TaxID=990650 RepID=A0A0C9UCQ1_SPHS4|nr:hypothetical protein M422DRAFT_276660 [Sphaerobolus stellatus SS14]